MKPILHVPYLIGSWHLHKWQMLLDGVASLPYTDRAEGMLTYADDGHMSAFLHHPAWRDVEVVDASTHMLFGAYAGRWSVNQHTVRHHVQFASAPALIGTTLVRAVRTLTLDCLVLESERQPGSAQHILEWRLR